MTNQVMKLLCAAVLLMAFSVTAFPEPDVTELKINVEVSIRPHLVAAPLGTTSAYSPLFLHVRSTSPRIARARPRLATQLECTTRCACMCCSQVYGYHRLHVLFDTPGSH